MARPGRSHDDPVTKKGKISVEPNLVMRPLIRGVSNPIPIVTQSKEERQATVEYQLAALTKRSKPVIKVIENTTSSSKKRKRKECKRC